MTSYLSINNREALATDEAVLRHGKLQLEFALAPNGRTFLGRQYSTYPFHICRAHYLDAAQPDMVSLYTQSCSGGIFAGDRLNIDIQATDGALAHLTTQASTVVHSMESDEAIQTVNINAAPGAYVEYLPDPNILFPNAKLRSRVRVRAAADASIIVADGFLPHDPSGKRQPFSYFESEVRVEDEQSQLVALDRFEISGEDFARGHIGQTGHYGTHGALLIINRSESKELLMSALRAKLNGLPDIYAGISTLPGDCGIWLRLLAKDGIAFKRAYQAAWRETRYLLTGNYPSVRRK